MWSNFGLISLGFQLISFSPWSSWLLPVHRFRSRLVSLLWLWFTFGSSIFSVYLQGWESDWWPSSSKLLIFGMTSFFTDCERLTVSPVSRNSSCYSSILSHDSPARMSSLRTPVHHLDPFLGNSPSRRLAAIPDIMDPRLFSPSVGSLTSSLRAIILVEPLCLRLHHHHRRRAPFQPSLLYSSLTPSRVSLQRPIFRLNFYRTHTFRTLNFGL